VWRGARLSRAPNEFDFGRLRCGTAAVTSHTARALSTKIGATLEVLLLTNCGDN